eukprot:1190332-Prorocentrum_minimum.AAC.2
MVFASPSRRLTLRVHVGCIWCSCRLSPWDIIGARVDTPDEGPWDIFSGERGGVCAQGEEQGGRRAPHGLRPPRLQELRPPRQVTSSAAKQRLSETEPDAVEGMPTL